MLIRGEWIKKLQYLLTWVLLSDKEEWTIDTYNNMNGSKNNNAGWKKTDKRVHTVWFHLSMILENTNYGYRKQISGFCKEGSGSDVEEAIKELKDILQDDIFFTSIVVSLTGVYIGLSLYSL